jgi:hypothetical protein
MSSSAPEAIGALVADLAAPGNDRAERSLAAQNWTPFTASDITALFTTFVSAVTEANLLPRRLQAERIRHLLERVPPANLDSDALMAAAASFPPHLRATIASALPVSMRRGVYQRETTTSVSNEDVFMPISSDPADRTRPDTSEVNRRTTPEGTPSFEYATALALSNPDWQDANIKILGQANLNVRLVESLGEIEAILSRSNDVCLCVLDGSVLRTLDAQAQTRLFSLLAGYSTFLRIRVQDSGLALTRAGIRNIVREVRGLFSQVSPKDVCFDSEPTISESEVADLRSGYDHLRAHESARFVVGELSERQARLLIAAARARMESQGLTGSLEISSVTTRFLSGGRSGARLATVRVNESRVIFVARVTTASAAIDEIKRFNKFVRLWDPELQPELYYHREDAVILNALVAADPAQLQPATMLEDCISDLWNDQWLGLASDGELTRRTELLVYGLDWAVKRLEVLNGDRSDDEFPVAANPTVNRIAELEATGFNSGFGSEAIRARTIAFDRFDRLAHAAVVHGDIHLRNMLVANESRVHFIDYGSAGPGHPAIDLVRLELSLYTGQVRQFEPEAECVDLQRALSVEFAELGLLNQRFSSFFQCRVNEVCARTMVAARDAAIRVLREHGGDVRDYQAAKYIVAWQQLGMIGVNTALARSAINALTPEILSW